MMERPDEHNLVVRQRADRQPGQRRQCQVQAGGAVVGEQLGERVAAGGLGVAAPVEVGDGQPRVAVHDLQRLVDVFPGDRGAQDRRAIHGMLPGRSQDGRVADARQVQSHLADVGPRRCVDQAVEDHAGLHGGQRVDVVDGPAVPGEAVGGGLVEVGEGEVGRGSAARARLRCSGR